MNDIQLGKLIEGGDARRDAVHVAVAPVRAGGDLSRGARVRFDPTTSEVFFVPHGAEAVGVIDPFLDVMVVPKGRWCWLFVHPGTVTGMRHHWEHPAFPDQPLPTREQVTAGEPGPAGSKRLSDLQYSEEWLRRYAEKLNCYEGPEEAYQHLLEGLKSGELYAHGSDLHGLYELEDAEELRQHAELVLGKCIDWNTFTFSCSC